MPEQMVTVRLLHGMWIDNPNKVPGGLDTIKIPRGTEMEMTLADALNAIEKGTAERVKPETKPVSKPAPKVKNV